MVPRPAQASLSVVLVAGFLLTTPAPSGGASTCFGKVATIVGTSGPDEIVGTSGGDVIMAFGANDTIRARGGPDRVCGGKGEDTIILARGSDKASGGREGDVIVGGPGKDVLVGRKGHDTLSPGEGDDVSKGGDANDFIVGSPGDDAMRGGEGHFDTVWFGNAAGPIVVDLAIAGPQNTGQGIDRIDVEGLGGSEFDDLLFGTAGHPGNGLFGEGGNDQIDGREDVDYVIGNRGADELYGGEDDDQLYGNQGNDLLVGGEGGENLGDFGTGGPGTDECRELESHSTCENVIPPSGSPRRGTGSPTGWAAIHQRWEQLRALLAI